MKTLAGCHIQEDLGPTTPCMKHQQIMQSAQIAKAWNEDMNIYQKSFYLIQKHQVAAKGRKTKHVSAPSALFLPNF